MSGLIHTFLNLAAPPLTAFSLLFFFIPFQFAKLLLSLLAAFFPEDAADKVVLITGASSGIGESLAYEYAKRGACLVLAARREASLREVAEKARDLGSPDVIVVRADVAKAADCRRIVDQTMNHFGRLDHLVNNAGISSVATLEDAQEVNDLRAVMDVNFWASVYMTKFAIPYLRNSGGRIVVLSSASSWIPTPKMSFYNASKAAVSQFFETLRVEFGSDIGITLVTPGYIDSEFTQGKIINTMGKLEVEQDMGDVQVSLLPIVEAEKCAKAIVEGVLRGERYVTEPRWVKVTYLWKVCFPEVMDWVFRSVSMVAGDEEMSGEAFGKRVLEYTGGKGVAHPEALQEAEPKRD